MLENICFRAEAGACLCSFVCWREGDLYLTCSSLFSSSGSWYLIMCFNSERCAVAAKAAVLMWGSCFRLALGWWRYLGAWYSVSVILCAAAAVLWRPRPGCLCPHFTASTWLLQWDKTLRCRCQVLTQPLAPSHRGASAAWLPLSDLLRSSPRLRH